MQHEWQKYHIHDHGQRRHISPAEQHYCSWSSVSVTQWEIPKPEASLYTEERISSYCCYLLHNNTAYTIASVWLSVCLLPLLVSIFISDVKKTSKLRPIVRGKARGKEKALRCEGYTKALDFKAKAKTFGLRPRRTKPNITDFQSMLMNLCTSFWIQNLRRNRNQNAITLLYFAPLFHLHFQQEGLNTGVISVWTDCSCTRVGDRNILHCGG